MDATVNRMSSTQKRGESTKSQPAPPVVVFRKVLPCVCPACGKAQQPRVVTTWPDKNEARVECTACGRPLVYSYATEQEAVPRVRVTRHRLDSTY